MPKRIQRKRTKGWRMPENAVYVGRPTKFGNPFRLGVSMTRLQAINGYREWLTAVPDMTPMVREELRGKDLVCWCSLDQPCHADVLLEIANG